MAVTLAALTTTVRRMIGDPDTTELPDATIQGFLNEDVLDWVNRRRPSRTVSSLTTVANQQDYTDKPATAYRVVEVWWLSSDFEFFSASMKYLPSDLDLNSTLAGFDVLQNAGLVESFYKQISAYQGKFAGIGYETEDGKIRLTPVPGSTGDLVYFEYTLPRWSDIINVDPIYQPGIKCKACSLCLEYLFIKRGMVRGGKDFSGGGGANEQILAASYNERADAEIPCLTSPFGRG